jgi:threonine dehydratase
VFLLSDAEAARGVATHSSGNHAAALSRAAKARGIPAYIVMPNNAPQAKRAAVERLGGKIVFCEPNIPAREAAAAKIIADTGATLVHPYDDVRVMAGQGTATLELLEQAPELDIIVGPIGGGGLISGTAVAAHGINPAIRVIGAEPAGADDAYRSLQSGKRIAIVQSNTIADGLRSSTSERTFTEMRTHLDEAVTVTEESIIAAMRSIWEVLKIVVEPSGAVSYGSIVEKKIDARGKRVGIILTGGNLDLDKLPWTA